MANAVIDIPAAPVLEAEAHFANSFRFETDCWDVHDALSRPDPGFVLLDVRGPDTFAKGHVPGAINLPHGKIIASKMAAWPTNTLFVTYCAGPHCNGAASFMAGLAGTIEQLKGQTTGVSDVDLDSLAAKARNQANTLTTAMQNVRLTTGTAVDLTNPQPSA